MCHYITRIIKLLTSFAPLYFTYLFAPLYFTYLHWFNLTASLLFPFPFLDQPRIRTSLSYHLTASLLFSSHSPFLGPASTADSLSDHLTACLLLALPFLDLPLLVTRSHMRIVDHRQYGKDSQVAKANFPSWPNSIPFPSWPNSIPMK